MKVQLKLNQVCGFEEFADYYEVETDGDYCWVTSKNGKVLKTGDCHGYQIYGFQLKSGKEKKIREHRLFAICFIENPENKSDVNHIDGVKTNNSLSNLEWVTSSENMQHAFRTGLKQPILGEQNGRAKLKNSEIPLIFNMRKTGLTQKAIGDHFGISQVQISRILRSENRSQKTFFEETL
jgi:hypothetical protein